MDHCIKKVICGRTSAVFCMLIYLIRALPTCVCTFRHSLFLFFSSFLSLFYSSSVDVRRRFMADLFRMLFPEHDSLIKETIIHRFCLSFSSFSPLLSFPSFVFLFHSTHTSINSNTFQHCAPCELRWVSVGECIWSENRKKKERKKKTKADEHQPPSDDTPPGNKAAKKIAPHPTSMNTLAIHAKAPSEKEKVWFSISLWVLYWKRKLVHGRLKSLTTYTCGIFFSCYALVPCIESTTS